VVLRKQAAGASEAQLDATFTAGARLLYQQSVRLGMLLDGTEGPSEEVM
jgi:hypothetical protein